jgi:dTDP-glucose pyrophosphorylase
MKSPISTFLVAPDSTLREAMACIDRNVKGIALVVDGRRRLLGVVTDGDIRRALLAGAGLEARVDAHMQRRCTSVGPDAGRAEVLDLMRARSIEQIPILAAGNILVGLHSLRDIIGAAERPNWAVIMAGGQGIRLRPVTEHIPKPMIEVAGRPILERLVLHLVGFGIRRIYLSVAHLGHVIEDHFGDGSRFGCKIRYLREQKSMGTGGALSLLKERPADPLLVMNGDLITQTDIPALLRFHQSGRYAATMAIRRYGHQIPFGCVEVINSRVVQLEEKPILERLVNAGIYVLNPELLKQVPRRFFPITDLFAACLVRKHPVGAFEIEEEWLDVGQREQLKQGRMP